MNHPMNPRDNELASNLLKAFTKSSGSPVPILWAFSYNPTLSLALVPALAPTLARYIDKNLQKVTKPILKLFFQD